MAGWDPRDLSHLIARIGTRDVRAFDALHRQTKLGLLGVCRSILHDHKEAEDALQEVFTNVWKHAGRFEEDRLSAVAWLTTIARNEAIARLRRIQRSPIMPNMIDHAAETVADMSPNPEANLIRSTNAEILERCFQELGSPRADAVRGAYLEGRSYLELAEIYDVPLNTMRTWLRRGLIQMRASFERENGVTVKYHPPSTPHAGAAIAG